MHTHAYTGQPILEKRMFLMHRSYTMVNKSGSKAKT